MVHQDCQLKSMEATRSPLRCRPTGMMKYLEHLLISKVGYVRQTATLSIWGPECRGLEPWHLPQLLNPSYHKETKK